MRIRSEVLSDRFHGQKVIIKDIHSSDSYYQSSNKYINKTGTFYCSFLNKKPTFFDEKGKQYYTGAIHLDCTPIHSVLYFYSVRIALYEGIAEWEV